MRNKKYKNIYMTIISSIKRNSFLVEELRVRTDQIQENQKHPNVNSFEGILKPAQICNKLSRNKILNEAQIQRIRLRKVSPNEQQDRSDPLFFLRNESSRKENESSRKENDTELNSLQDLTLCLLPDLGQCNDEIKNSIHRNPRINRIILLANSINHYLGSKSTINETSKQWFLEFLIRKEFIKTIAGEAQQTAHKILQSLRTLHCLDNLSQEEKKYLTTLFPTLFLEKTTNDPNNRSKEISTLAKTMLISATILSIIGLFFLTPFIGGIIITISSIVFPYMIAGTAFGGFIFSIYKTTRIAIQWQSNLSLKYIKQCNRIEQEQSAKEELELIKAIHQGLRADQPEKEILTNRIQTLAILLQSYLQTTLSIGSINPQEKEYLRQIIVQDKLLQDIYNYSEQKISRNILLSLQKLNCLDNLSSEENEFLYSLFPIDMRSLSTVKFQELEPRPHKTS
ncbi:MAG: hypothetical protein JW769_04755 [Parachlamydiales bacterium]|nr:hypothetical protein [Parachlamydiales bacterium]